MKKVKEFLLSIILPRKMYRHHSMKVIYSVFVFILSAFLLLFSINLSTKRFMKDMIGSVNFEENDYKVVNEIQLPKYRIAKSNSGGYYLDVEEVGEEYVGDRDENEADEYLADQTVGAEPERGRHHAVRENLRLVCQLLCACPKRFGSESVSFFAHRGKISFNRMQI